MIPGIDVSHWQGEIDWAEVKRSGVVFAFIKVSEFPDKRTKLHVDVRFQENKEGAIKNKIYWSAYHFFRTHIDPIIQAQVFCEAVDKFDSLPPVMDLEVAGCKGKKLNLKVSAFLEEVEKLTNRRPIIYTSGGFWRPMMMYEKRTDVDWASKYPIWLAQYTSTWPTACYPWAGWDFWQYSDKGRIPGIKASVDLNWFNGTLREFEERFIYKNMAMNERNDGNEHTGKKEEKLLGSLQRADNSALKNEQIVTTLKSPILSDEGAIDHQEQWIKEYFF